jgi:acyl-coenzyme A synthetase/AMP-(fatty) acid ligase
LPDREIGNRIRAVVVLREGAMPGEALADEIRTTLKQRIAPYKVPQVIEFIDVLPKSAVGKVLRRELIATTT